MKNRHILLATSILSLNVWSQDTIPLSKTDLHSKVLENNLQIKIAEKNYQAAKADYN